jgi:hypothetical protein
MFLNWNNWKKKKTEQKAAEPIALKPLTSVEKTKEMRGSAMAEFYDIPILSNLTDPMLFEMFVDPVVTSAGRVYSSRPLAGHLKRVSTDPLTNEPLTAGQVHGAPEEITTILDDYNRLRLDTISQILKAKHDDSSAETAINTYQLRMIQLDDKMGEACQQLVTQAQIKKIKNNLKIDETNNEHKIFWQGKGKIRHHIPTHVQKMMTAANDSYDTVEDFLDAINGERRGSNCMKFFKYCLRDGTTRNLYDQKDENLKTFVVR